MASDTPFGKAITFFEELGVYEVVLPFLLIFTIVFAILDRTKVLGTEKVGEDVYPKKNLNAMVAFIVAFLVVASSALVKTINEALANIMLLLLMIVFFIMLVGVLYKEGDPVLVEEGWKRLFAVIMFIGISLIFLWAIKVDNNSSICSEFTRGECPWLALAWGWLVENWNTNVVASIVLLIIIIGFMYFVTSDKKPEHHSHDDKKKNSH